MKNTTQWGLAAGLAAALAFAPGARAQSSTSSSGSTDTPSGTTTRPESGKSGSPAGETTTGSGGSHASSSSASSMGSGSSASSTGSQKVDKDLQKGLQELHAANQAEIQMGQMGESTATSPQVKEFARKMVEDHQKNDQQLEQMAQTMGVQLTGEDFQKRQEKSQKDMEKVHGKSGADFDAMYMEHMVKDHEKDSKAVKDLAKKAQDKKHTELASFLQTTHQKMQEHLTQAKQVEKVAKNEKKGSSSQVQGRHPSGGSSSTGTGSSSGMSGSSSGSGTGTEGSTSNGGGTSGSAGSTTSGSTSSGTSGGSGRPGGSGGGGGGGGQ